MKRFFLTLLVGGIYMLSGAPLAAFTLTYTAGPGGTISGKTPQTVLAGKTGTAVKAVPMALCRFVRWSDLNPSLTRTDPAADLAVTAIFEPIPPRLMLAYIAGVGGTISGTATQTVLPGANGTAVKAVPKAGYHFVKWSDETVAFKPTFNRQEPNVLATKIVTAEFAVTEVTKLVVLKGTVADTVHYVYNDPVPATSAAQRAALGVDVVSLAALPKVYYFLVVDLTYVPQMSALTSLWTGEGNILAYPMGAVEYGIGQHDAGGVWQPKLAYAYNVGTAFWFGSEGSYDWWWTAKAKERVGDASIYSNVPFSNLGGGETSLDQRDGYVNLVYGATLVTNKLTGDSRYEPSISSLTISYTQWLQQFCGPGAAGWKTTQFGAGKVAFVQDTTLTNLANQMFTVKHPLTGNDVSVNGVRAGEVVKAINVTVLVKNKYPAIPATTDLDPDGSYPFP